MMVASKPEACYDRLREGYSQNKGEEIMRVFRFALVFPIALAALALLSSPASASTIPTQLSIGQAQLGPLGASVSVTLTFTCDPTLNVAFGDASVTQVSGHKLVPGVGSFINNFPGVPCTGASETVTLQVNASGSFAFKQGHKAIASADLTVFDPVSTNLSTTSVTGQAITITK
jgi:hypothetical protein